MYQYIEKNEEFFPNILREIPDSPKRLYYQGNIKLINTLCFSVIGSRNLTEYGKRIEKRFMKEINSYGITIVSGMAIGADSVAHQETLNNQGGTIAVLPCGFNHIFPKENIELYQRIVRENGLVITEYEENVYASSKRFLERNRIVSGLSKGLLVVEAQHRSGTSVTVKLAKLQGRKVFAFPGRLDSKNGIGVNRFIKEGAILVTSMDDIIREIPEFQDLKKIAVCRSDAIKKEYRKIYSILSDEPMSIEDICFRTKNELPAVINLITLMEMDDLVQEILGAGYVKKDKE